MHGFLRLFTLILLLSVGSTSLSGQQTIYDEESLLFTKSLHGGLHIHPRGWGLNFYYGDIQSVDRTVYYGLEVLGMKHSKERKNPNSTQQDANAYAYGKLNSLYIIRPSVGVKTTLTDKLRKSGVEISWNNSIGPSIGITKPVYLEIEKVVDGFRTYSVERYDPDIHTANNIYGRASALEGFGELNIWPGVHVKSGLFFEFSPYQRQLKGVEVGMALDGYLKKVPLMALERNNQFFHSFYINLFFGRKYNRSVSE